MSRETIADLNTNTLIGYTDKRGHAWHYRADAQSSEPNHYAGAIPVEDVRRRLFGWHVKSAPVEAQLLLDDGVQHVVDPSRQLLVRDDTFAPLAVHSSSYQVHQFDEWLLDTTAQILDSDLAIGSAGLLRGGAVAWVQIEMEDTITHPSGVAFRPHLTAATSHDGSLATTYKKGSQIVVCDNTLSVAMSEKVAEQLRIRHTSGSVAKLAAARDAVGVIHGIADDFAAELDALTARTVTDAQWHKFLAKSFGPSSDAKAAQTISARKIGELEQLWTSDERVAPWKNTEWGVLAAVNTWAHHIADVRNVSRAERNMERAISGGVDALDRTTLSTLHSVLV